MDALDAIRSKLKGKTIHIVPYMHADWAWCHTRAWHETRYANSILDNIDLLDELPDYRFYLDCWRTEMVPFLEKYPEKLEALRKAVISGRIAICGAFSNVRPNMVDGEAYIRNMIIGRSEWSRLFPGADLSVHADAVDVALGHPQMPQLLAKSGYRYYRAGRPYELIGRKGFPRHFYWKGLDGSKILLWWGEYGGITFQKNTDRIFVNDWDQAVEAMYKLELRRVAESAASRNIEIHQGCDDSLPLCVFNGSNPIDLPGFMEKWNSREASHMRFSTPVEFFRELEAENRSRTVDGTIDCCDVSYNVAWGGEKGLAAKRIQGSELLCAAERMTACARLMGVMDWVDTTEYWKDNLTASAHATQWLFETDIAEIFDRADRPIEFAKRQLKTAAKAMLSRIVLPRNAVVTAFNPFGHEVVAPLEFTVTCAQIDELQLADGAGRALPFQVVNHYAYANEYTNDLEHTVWEYDVAVLLNIPAHGWNTVVAQQGRIDCRVSGFHTPGKNPPEFALGAGARLSMDNGVLKLEFIDGNLGAVRDMKTRATVNPDASTPWNVIEYVQVDTTKGVLHCGPVVSRQKAQWRKASLLEQGPVRWKVRLSGELDGIEVTQDICLHAGERKIYFTTEMQNDGSLEGYVAFAVPADVRKLSGGINFGTEKKDVLNEPYFAYDDPGADMHRLRDGLFFAKDFVSYESGDYRIALCPRLGDRYFLFHKDTSELAYIHMGTARADMNTWERNVNEFVFNAKGRHVFEDMVVVGSSKTPPVDCQNAAYAYRLEPVLARPVFYNTHERPLPLTGSLLSVDAPNVQISAAFIENGSLAVRLWECAGKETRARLTLPVDASAVQAEDFIGNQDPSARVTHDGGLIIIDFRPWEIVTLRCTLAAERQRDNE